MEGNRTLKFRTLRADEVECRIATISDKGLSLLLYKDARVDQNVLDETVGVMNWKREHQMIGDRLYCTVSLWDPEKKQWVSKQDVGTESYTEKEKGQASDGFKRACFNLGIGRELYTAPFIWISASDCRISEKNGKKICYDKFRVARMEVKDGNISALEIWNDSLKRMAYSFCNFPKDAPASESDSAGRNGGGQGNNSMQKKEASQGSTQRQETMDERADAKMKEEANQSLIDGTKIKVIRDAIRKKGLSEASILGHYRLEKFEDMTMAHWANAMQLLGRYPDKEGRN